jgi:plasmid stabilization system protein ParE
MAVELVFTAEVEQDLGQAFAWYERRRRGLGDEFLTHVDACLQRICRNPESCERVRLNYRRALVRRFPYAVIYESVGETITVYVICHTSQDSDQWLSRLPK